MEALEQTRKKIVISGQNFKNFINALENKKKSNNPPFLIVYQWKIIDYYQKKTV